MRESRSAKFWVLRQFWEKIKHKYIIRKRQATVTEQVTWVNPVTCHKSVQQISANSRNLPIRSPRTKFVLIKCDSRESWSRALQEIVMKLILREGRQVDRTERRCLSCLLHVRPKV